MKELRNGEGSASLISSLPHVQGIRTEEGDFIFRPDGAAEKAEAVAAGLLAKVMTPKLLKAQRPNRATKSTFPLSLATHSSVSKIHTEIV